MQLVTQQFNGIAFVLNPYATSQFLRQDLFDRQFQVRLHSQTEYVEDNPLDGTFWLNEMTLVGHCGLLADATTLAEAAVVQMLNRSVPCHQDPGCALDYVPRRVVINDRFGNLVLCGTVSNGILGWLKPVEDEAEAALRKSIDALYAEAAFESGWDNYSTAQGLREHARRLESRLVSPQWLPHVLAHLAKLENTQSTVC